MWRATSGWRSPWRRIESARSPSASSSKCRRGCSGLGTISWIGTASSPGAAAATRPSGAAGKSASMPFPSAFRTPLSIQLFFLRRMGIVTPPRRGAWARPARARRSPAPARGTRRRRVARGLRHAYVAGDDGAKDLLAEVGTDLVLDLSGEAVAPVEHREEQALERE